MAFPEPERERAPDGEVPPSKLKPAEWVELARAEGGVIETKGRRVQKVAFPHGEWTIVLDTFSDGETSATRFHVPFRVRSPMTLRIQRHNVFTRLATGLGMTDVEVPAPVIDREFLIRTDNASVVRSLVLDRRFAEALLGLKRGLLQVARVRRGLRRVPDAGELRWSTTGVIRDTEILTGALRLMRFSVDGLTRLGVMREPL